MSLKQLVFVCAFVISTGCSPSPPPTTFAAINSQILQRSCANFSTCHSDQGQKTAANLNLAHDPYNALVDQPSTEPGLKDATSGYLLVKRGDPDHSLLYIKLMLPLAATDDGGFEESMPLGNPHLPDTDISGIHTWILNGALNN
jgi:hypothetical protein